MSRFSGKSDLADIILTQKMYPVYPGNLNSPLTSDEMECFNIFKEKTKGVIHQHFKLELNEMNIDKEIEIVNSPRMLSKKEIPWGDGKEHRTKKYVYIYWGKEYNSLKELNKKGYYSTKKIKFDTLLDIIPYYPHIVSFMSSDSQTMFVVISGESYVDYQYEEFRKFGSESSMYDFYRKELQNHYVEVVNTYFKGL
jgi:hypothetical protein